MINKVDKIEETTEYKYAQDIISGKIVACENIKDAARRFIHDVEEFHNKGKWFYYDLEERQRYLDHASKYGRVKINGQPVAFDHLPWQCFVQCQLYCWKCFEDNPFRKPPGRRRFDLVALIVAKTNGKTPMNAWNPVYLAGVDKDPAFNSRILAYDKAQGFQITNQAEWFFTNIDGVGEAGNVNNKLPNKYKKYADGHILFWNADNLKCELKLVAPSEAEKEHGEDLSLVIVEEFGTHKSDAPFKILQAGANKTHPEPIIYVTSNVAEGKYGPLWELRARMLQAHKDFTKMTNVLPMFYESDEDDDPMIDADTPWDEVKEKAEKIWIKSNPSLKLSPSDPGTIGVDKIAKPFIEANSHAERATAARLFASKWMDPIQESIDIDMFDLACAKPFPKAVLSSTERDSYAAILWSNKLNMSCIVMVTPYNKGYVVQIKYFWNSRTLHKQSFDMQPKFKQWRDDKHVHITRASDANDAREACNWLLRHIHRFKAIACNEDQWQMFSGEVQKSGINVLESSKEVIVGGAPMHFYSRGDNKNRGMSLKLWEGVNAFEEFLGKDFLTIQNNPVLRWNMQNVEVVFDRYDNRIYKRSDSNKQGLIDGALALNMALGLTKLMEINDEIGLDMRNYFNAWTEAFKNAEQQSMMAA